MKTLIEPQNLSAIGRGLLRLLPLAVLLAMRLRTGLCARARRRLLRPRLQPK